MGNPALIRSPLTSQPIAIFNPLVFKRDPVSSLISFFLHTAVLALLLWFALQTHKQMIQPVQVEITPVDIQPYIPIPVPAVQAMSGGGGGAHAVVETNKRKIMSSAKPEIVPLETLKIGHPKLAVMPREVIPQQIKLPGNQMPNIGDTQSAQVTLVSQGMGRGSGFGHGIGGGMGSSMGIGVGPGGGGGYGGGIMTVGGGVTAPQVIHTVEPEFTDAARQAKYQGVVSIQLIVDPQGNPEDIRIVRHLGMGLDEKATEAVKQYKFRPSMFQGHPVPVQIFIDVEFHLL